MLSGGEALEAYALRSASSVLRALAKRMPSIAHVKRDGGITDVALADVAVGDTVVIYPHEVSPVDGTVVEGHGLMNEAYLTGEPFEITKANGSAVISGAVNGESALSITATHRAADSRYAKIMEVMRESEQNQPHLRRLGDQLGAIYTPVAVAIALAAWATSGNAVRFLAVPGDRHALSLAHRHSGGHYRRHFPCGATRHNHQKPCGPGTDFQLPHRHFRQNRNPDLRRTQVDRAMRRSRLRARRRSGAGGES